MDQIVNPGSGVFPLTVYYESACPLCDAEMTNLMLRNRAGLLRFEDVSNPRFDALPPGATLDDLMACIHAQRADGAVIKGVEVFRLAYGAVGVGWVVAPTSWPLLNRLSERAYAWVARNRHAFPRWLVRAIFETFVRRAALKAAKTRCTAETCDI